MALFFLLTFPTLLNAQILTSTQAQEASCRVYSGVGYGSGTVFFEDSSKYYILTNGHVTNRGRNYTVEFYRRGFKSSKYSATLVKQVFNKDLDVAVLSVNKTDFKFIIPRIIPIAEKESKYNGYIFGSGCPAARWMQMWESVIIVDEGSRILFTMPPEGGQSGSGILGNVNGNTRIIGIVTWRIGNSIDNTIGGGVSLATLHRVLNENATSSDANELPDHYYPVQLAIPDSNFVLGSDGIVYVKNSEGGVAMPVGITVVDWNFCPPGQQQPPSSGGSGNKNDLQNPWENDVPSPGPVKDSKEVDGLKKQIKDLQNEQKKYITANDEFKGTINDLQRRIDEKQSELDKLSTDIVDSNEKCKELDAKLKKLMFDMGNLDESNKNLEKQKSELGKLAGDLAIEKDIAEEENKSLIQRGKDLVKNLGNLQDQYNEIKNKIDKGELVPPKTMWEQFGEYRKGNQGLFYTIFAIITGYIIWRIRVYSIGRVGPKIAGIGEFLIKFGIGRVKDRVYDNNLDNNNAKKSVPVYNNSEDINLRKYDPVFPPDRNRGEIKPVPEPIVEKIEKTIEEVKVSTTNETLEDNNTNTNSVINTINVITGKGNNSYAEEIMSHKERNGENKQDWAYLAILYKEAVDNLRKGDLLYKNKSLLQGQSKAAEAIDDWVRTQYYYRTDRETILSNTLNMDKTAMLGFLYKEAVDLLKRGDFKVLGNVETAEAIETWVQKEFLRRT
jgi:hypothetical protein